MAPLSTTLRTGLNYHESVGSCLLEQVVEHPVVPIHPIQSVLDVLLHHKPHDPFVLKGANA